MDVNAIAADVTQQLIKESILATFQSIGRTAKFAYGALFTDFEKHTLRNI